MRLILTLALLVTGSLLDSGCRGCETTYNDASVDFRNDTDECVRVWLEDQESRVLEPGQSTTYSVVPDSYGDNYDLGATPCECSRGASSSVDLSEGDRALVVIEYVRDCAVSMRIDVSRQ
jgi:hypothetical protein